MITNGWKGKAFAVLSLAAVACLAGGVGAGNDKRAVPMSEVAGSPVLAAVTQPPPARVDQEVKPPPQTVVKEAQQENWPLTLLEALRIAMDNSEIVRVFAFSAQNAPVGGFKPPPLDAAGEDRKSTSTRMTIGPSDPDSSVWRFKSQAMAKLRAVELQYWNLVQMHVQLWGVEQAFRLATEIQSRETAELQAGRGTAADVAEASQRLEQFNLERMTRTSDVITTERELRKELGLALADNRRIVPVTFPTEELVDPNWDTCLAEMMTQQPEIVLKKLAVAEVPVPTTGVPRSTDQRSSAEMNESGDSPRKQRQKILQETVHQRTHSLARFFLEIDANYKQFKTASRLRAAAAQRLDAQRAYYEEGRITIDRFLDAVSQYATAVATEAQYKTTYNVSIVALEEAKGTLLADRDITIVEEFRRPRSLLGNDKRNQQTATASFKGPTAGNAVSIPPAPAVGSVAAAPFPPEKSETDVTSHKAASDARSTPKVWSFSFSIGRERPFLIRGTISEGTNDRRDATAQ